MTPFYEDTRAGILIYNADCREVLSSLRDIDLVLTDPPYGLGSWTATGGNSISPAEAKEISKWDVRPVSAELLLLALAKGKTWICWGGNYFAGVLGPCRTPLVWDKQQSEGMHFADGEIAFTNFKHGSLSIFRQPFYQTDYKNNRVHPTQKSIGLMDWCIRKSRTEGTILDPFMGSGTTLRAAKDLGRRAIGIEIEERYCEIAARRLQESQPAVFIDPPREKAEQSSIFAEMPVVN